MHSDNHDRVHQWISDRTVLSRGIANNNDDHLHNSIDSHTPINVGDCTKIPLSKWLCSLSFLFEIWPRHYATTLWVWEHKSSLSLYLNVLKNYISHIQCGESRLSEQYLVQSDIVSYKYNGGWFENKRRNTNGDQIIGVSLWSWQTHLDTNILCKYSDTNNLWK